MEKAEAIARLKAHESDLRALGIEHVSIFGSTARGESVPGSDLDLAIKLRPGALPGLAFFGLADDLSTMLGAPVDVVTEPARKARLQAEIDRDRLNVF